MEQWVDSLHVGGLIVSVGSPLDIAAKLNRLQERSSLPLLIASDLEGGTSIRFNGGTPLPPNMGVAATGSDSAAYEMGRITALEGRAVGIHLAFAPVADVNNNPDNPIINTRSFGEDPAAVGRLVAAEVRGLQDHGMLATAKHFPGHGDTGTDSHLALPVITSSWSRLDSVELVPFRSAIAAGVKVVMSAHIALPGIDPGELRPGTVAPSVLTGILRDSLAFDGLVVTDALDMGGITSAVRRGRLAARLSRRRRPAAPAGRSGRRDRRDGGGRRARRDHAGAARRARCGGCSRPSATSASSPAGPSRSTACPAWSAAPGSSTRRGRWRLARW